MITDDRLYWILHGLFANAQTLSEVVFIVQKFEKETDLFDAHKQLMLSVIKERRSSELESIRHESGFREGEANGEAPSGPSVDRANLRAQPAASLRSGPTMADRPEPRTKGNSL